MQLICENNCNSLFEMCREGTIVAHTLQRSVQFRRSGAGLSAGLPTQNLVSRLLVRGLDGCRGEEQSLPVQPIFSCRLFSNFFLLLLLLLLERLSLRFHFGSFDVFFGGHRREVDIIGVARFVAFRGFWFLVPAAVFYFYGPLGRLLLVVSDATEYPMKLQFIME